MEKRDQILLLLAAGGIGYAVYSNWDMIREKLGLDDMYPGRLKAVDLAKKARTLDQYRTNWEILNDRQSAEEIRVGQKPWTAEEIDDPLYRVTFTYTEAGQTRRYVFHVNVATLAVQMKTGLNGELATAPR